MLRWGILNRVMPQSLSAVYIHLVFSTKDRRPFLRDKPIRDALYSYLGGVSKQLDCPPLLVGGVDDHARKLDNLGLQVIIPLGLSRRGRAGTSPCLVIIAVIFSRLGGPPALATVAISRKYSGPMSAGVTTAERCHLTSQNID